MASLHWIFRPICFPASRGLRQYFRSVLDRCEAAENLITIPKKTSKSLESLRKPDGSEEFLEFSMGFPSSFNAEVGHRARCLLCYFISKAWPDSRGAKLPSIQVIGKKGQYLSRKVACRNLKLATSGIQREKGVKRVKGEFWNMMWCPPQSTDSVTCLCHLSSLNIIAKEFPQTGKNQPNILGGKSLFWGASFQIVEDWRPDSPNGVGTSVLNMATKFCPGKRNRTYDRSHQRREWRLCCNCVLVYPGSCAIYSHPNQAS